MFRLTNPQKVCTIAGVEVGGQPGERPPLLIANMFQTGDKLFISRKDFNVRWNQLLEPGGMVVGDNVRITLHIEAVRNK